MKNNNDVALICEIIKIKQLYGNLHGNETFLEFYFMYCMCSLITKKYKRYK